MTSTSGDGPAAGWYPDPERPDRQRYWDGTGWTEHRHPATTGPSPGASTGQGLDETAVLPTTPGPDRAEQPAQSGTATRGRTSGGDGRGWVAALAGLVAGLVIGGAAAAVLVGNHDGSSSAPSGGTQDTPATAVSTVTSTTTATVTQTITQAATQTATATATATQTVTVTASASP